MANVEARELLALREAGKEPVATECIKRSVNCEKCGGTGVVQLVKS